ncbi:MAG: hypothetical protein LBR40_01805 [Bacilli bacterium]|jgi:hypothetical protein|nr:hypothetical protein [Bacilli bacterium]
MKKIMYGLMLGLFIFLTSNQLEAMNVSIRVESNEKTLIEKTKVDVSPIDISNIVGGNSSDYTKHPVVLHALVKVLQDKGYDLSDKNILDCGFTGSYLSTILNNSRSKNGTYADEWMFTINNKYPVDVNTGYGYAINAAPLHENDSIVLFLTYDYISQFYSYFDKEELTVFDDEMINLTNYKLAIFDKNWNMGTDISPASDALVILEKKKSDGTYNVLDESNYGPGTLITSPNDGYVSNIKGEFSFIVNQPGEYNVTSRIDTAGYADEYDPMINELSRAHLKLIVKSRALDNAIKDASKYQESKYTNASYQNLSNSIDKAKAIFNNPYASDEEIKKSIDDLKINISNLQGKQVINNTNIVTNSPIKNIQVKKSNTKLVSNMPDTGSNSLVIVILFLSLGTSLLMTKRI